MEQKLVGTWKLTGMDHIYYYDLRADHSFIVISPDDGTPNHPIILGDGTWKIEGNDLVIEGASWKGDTGKDKYPSGIARIHIAQLTENKFVDDVGQEFIRSQPPKMPKGE